MTTVATAAAASRPAGPTALQHLAGDLDAVLAATLRPGSAPSSAGTRWAVSRSRPGRTGSGTGSRNSADAVALINTTTGDLLQKINLLRVPGMLAGGRALAAKRMIETFGGAPLFRGAARQPSFRRDDGRRRRGRSAIADFVHDLFAATPRRPRRVGQRARQRDGTAPIDLSGLTVPTW